MNECSLAELSDGRLMLNMRNSDEKEKTRKGSISTDGGMTWGNVYSDKLLIEPICEGNLFRYSFPEEGRSRLLFSNPADENRRRNMTLRLSYDEGSSWAKSMVLYSGPSAYSDLTRLSDGNIACFYETGYLNPNQGITFQKVSLKDLEK
jgi:sialidase-1